MTGVNKGKQLHGCPPSHSNAIGNSHGLYKHKGEGERQSSFLVCNQRFFLDIRNVALVHRQTVPKVHYWETHQAKKMVRRYNRKLVFEVHSTEGGYP